MKAESIHSHIKSLETQLEVLKAKAKGIADKRQKERSFGSLYGVLHARSDSTLDEISEAETHLR